MNKDAREQEASKRKNAAEILRDCGLTREDVIRIRFRVEGGTPQGRGATPQEAAPPAERGA